MENNMTISKYITELLNQNKGISVETNHIKDGSDKYGLFKSPSRNLKDLLDGSYEITEHYQFNARQNTVSEAERKEVDEWLEDLAYWADDYPLHNEFPELDKGRRFVGFSITGSPYPMEADSRETLYQMALSITYIREREVY